MKGLPRSMSRGPALLQEVVRQVIVVRNQTIAVASVSTAVGFGTGVIGDFPEGNILLLGAVGYLKFDGPGASADLTDTWEGDFSVGTVRTTDVTLSGAEVDILASTALAAAAAELGARTRAVNAWFRTQAFFDNTDNSLEANLNVLIDAAHIGDDTSVNILVNGEVHLLYAVIGDD